jgi:hypothetical protein
MKVKISGTHGIREKRERERENELVKRPQQPKLIIV